MPTGKKNQAKRLLFPLGGDSSYFILIIIYGIGVSLFTLAIPISVQALVNTVAFGVLYQPLVVLSLMVLFLLLFSGGLNLLQTYVNELFQRKFLARMGSMISEVLLLAKPHEMQKKNGEAMVNYYFDIMTVQKTMASLMTGGVSVVLQTLVGLILLGIYHPYFIIFDVILLIGLYCVWKFYGPKAMQTAVSESYRKYALANWLDDLARVNPFFKNIDRYQQAQVLTDQLVKDFIVARQEHFSKVFSQSFLLTLIYALMSALLLGLGGFLVMKGQLSLGQLVAAELVMTVILAGILKAGKYLENFYDLTAALDKLSYFWDIETLPSPSSALELQGPLKFQNIVYTTHHHQYEFHFECPPGQKIFIQVESFALKCILKDLMIKNLKPNRGTLSIGEKDYQEIDQHHLGKFLELLERPSILRKPILDFLQFGAQDPGPSRLEELLHDLDMSECLSQLPQKMQTPLASDGHPLYLSQVYRLEFARALLSPSKILCITDYYDLVEDGRRNQILQVMQKFKPEGCLIILSEGETRQDHFDQYVYITSEKCLVFKDLASYRKEVGHE